MIYRIMSLNRVVCRGRRPTARREKAASFKPSEHHLGRTLIVTKAISEPFLWLLRILGS